MFKIWLITGRPSTVSGLGEAAVLPFQFKTQAELDAFIMGVETAEGWLEVGLYSSEKEANDYVRACSLDYPG